MERGEGAAWNLPTTFWCRRHSLLAWMEALEGLGSGMRGEWQAPLNMMQLPYRMLKHAADFEAGRVTRKAYGCGSKPMVPFWGRCTTHFSKF